ncbi:MAG: rhomboid family intramembrane serine protease [Planctomycetes bacterium]|nr:rhomboid family intramembrane serine protease [Planctomycetota bacterium]
MIPLRDEHRLPRVPWATLLIIAACAFFFFLDLGADPVERARHIHRFGLVPRLQARLFQETWSALPAFSLDACAALAGPFFTSIFLHGGIEHLVGNVWFLLVFGHNVEYRFGHAGFLAFFLACGAASGVIHAVLSLDDPVLRQIGFRLVEIEGGSMPCIGASGAIAGVLGAYFVLFPRGRVLTWFPPFFVFLLPAVAFLAIWFVLQYVGLAGEAEMFTGVAYGAHVGGFLAGMTLAVTAMAVSPRRFAARGVAAV